METTSDHQEVSEQEKMEGEDHCIEPQLIRRHFHHLTLDINTANRGLSLSENDRKVSCVEQSYPDHPDRFNSQPQVLCTEGLTGCCYWEVEWSGMVAIAVTYRGINRRANGYECVILGNNDKSWSLECLDDRNGDRYSFIHNGKEYVLPVSPSGSNRVGVYVDWPAGTLSFYRVSSDTLTHLYTYQPTFTEPLYPGFWVSKYSSVSLLSSDEVDQSNMDISSFTPIVNTEDRTNKYRLSSDEVDQSNMVDTSSFTPIVNTEDTTNKYSFKFPEVGLFHCSVTGLVFGTTGEGEVLYGIVQWKQKLQSTGMTPAGPLFSIKCPQQSIYQLRLPHSYITPGDDLLVAHITDEGELELIKPQEVTQTQVVVNVTHLSLFGITIEIKKAKKKTRGQVLLFLRPPRGQRQILSVILLPSNVPLKEVQDYHKDDEHIKTTSNCVLIPCQSYSLQCTSYKVEPQDAAFELRPDNCHATFEVEMDLRADDVQLKLLGPENKSVWGRSIGLGRHCPLEAQSKGASILSALIPVWASDFVDQNRFHLIQRVKMVEPILDLLRQEGVITHEGQSDVMSERAPQKNMRKLMELLDSGGPKAKGIFYKGLEENEMVLLDDLTGALPAPLTEEQEAETSQRVTAEQEAETSQRVTEEQEAETTQRVTEEQEAETTQRVTEEQEAETSQRVTEEQEAEEQEAAKKKKKDVCVTL